MDKEMYIFKSSNGCIYGVLPEVVADNYGRYYENKGDDYEKRYRYMLQCFDDGSSEFSDWVESRMNFDEDISGKRFIDLDKLRNFPIRINNYDKVNGSEDFVLGIESLMEYAEALPIVYINNGQIKGE